MTFQNIAFTASDAMSSFDGPENSNITFNRDTFVDANAACSGGSATGYSGIFYVINAGSSTTQTGLTVENSVLRRADGPLEPGSGGSGWRSDGV